MVLLDYFSKRGGGNYWKGVLVCNFASYCLWSHDLGQGHLKFTTWTTNQKPPRGTSKWNHHLVTWHSGIKAGSQGISHTLSIPIGEGKLARNHGLGILFREKDSHSNTMVIVSPCLFIYYYINTQTHNLHWLEEWSRLLTDTGHCSLRTMDHYLLTMELYSNA